MPSNNHSCLLVALSLLGGTVASPSAFGGADCPAAGQPCLVDADCVDADQCNGQEFCQFPEVASGGGSCVCGDPPICDDGLDCTQEGCDPDEGCTYQTCNADADCDDGLYCNGAEYCALPAVAGGGIGLCACDELPCSEHEVCNEDTDECEAIGGCKTEGTSCSSDADCDDGAGCNGAEVCNLPATADCFSPDGTGVWIEPISQSQCLSMGWVWQGVGGCECGTPPICDDGVACTDDVCAESCPGCPTECAHPVSSGFCLIDGVCHAEGDRNPPQGCRVCDFSADPNGWTFLPVGSACDDQVAACLINGVCDEFGACGLEPHHELCDDEIDCTTDVCTPAGCRSTPSDGSCDDEIACTTDQCIAGIGCKHTPNHGVCGDGAFCNGAERCVVGVGCTPAPYGPCGSRPCDELRDRCRSGPNPTRPQAGTKTSSGS